jgi:L-seryl-tRNA(Ser) seleniumtransferase
VETALAGRGRSPRYKDFRNATIEFCQVLTKRGETLTIRLPSVDSLLRSEQGDALVGRYGRTVVLELLRAVLDEFRGRHQSAPDTEVLALCGERLAAAERPSQRPVFNLTGTVLHTNLGRAPLPAEAVRAASEVMGGPSNLEYDLDSGARGERDSHVRHRLRTLTGAEAATIVNNNAAAVLLVLNTLALRREVPVSRGELIEIGGAFRMPEIMARAGCRLREVGTTNRTHLGDFETAIGKRTALLLKVHPSNYAIEGFTSTVPDAELAALAHRHALPYVVDLGSGSLVDLSTWGLPHEPTPKEALVAGADLVTFSGDKLLGGPQAGIVVGRGDLVGKLDRNPLKRALRMDKGRLAALEAVLRLYADPDRLAQRLPILRLLTRKESDLEALGWRLLPHVTAVLPSWSVEVEACQSQVGSGSLPVDRLPSRCLAIVPLDRDRKAGGALARLAAAFRALSIPVIGRLENGRLKLDLRCLEDEAAFVAQLPGLGNIRQ